MWHAHTEPCNLLARGVVVGVHGLVDEVTGDAGFGPGGQVQVDVGVERGVFGTCMGPLLLGPIAVWQICRSAADRKEDDTCE